MFECFLDADSLDGIESEEFLEEIERTVLTEFGLFGEEGRERDLLFEWEGADVLARTTRFDAVVVFHCWGAEDVQDEGQLVVVCSKLA